MAKKPASLTSDLLARKGEAEPSSVDPVSRVTLASGRQPHLTGIGVEEGPAPGLYASPATERPQMYGSDEEERPRPPEPEIIYTPEDEEGSGRGRVIAFAFIGVALLVGVLVAFSLNDSGTGVAPVSPDLTAQPEAAAPQRTAPEVAAEAEVPAPAAEEPQDTAATPAETAPAEDAVAELRSTPETAAPVETAPAETAPVAIAPVESAPAEAAPAPAAQEPAPTPAPTAAAPAAAPASGGAFVVQIMALREEAAARTAWDALQAKHGAVLGGHALDIERADLGDKGVFFRVRAAGFGSKADAQSACTRLKSAGQDCMVKPR